MKLTTLFVLSTITITFTMTGCASKQNHFYEVEILKLQKEVATLKGENPNGTKEVQKKDAPVVAGEEKRATNNGTVAVADEDQKSPKPKNNATATVVDNQVKKASRAKSIPVSEMTGKKATPQKKAKPAKKTKKVVKKPLPLEKRVTKLEKTVGQHSRDINELKDVVDQIGWEVAKQGGMKHTKGFKIGPFKAGSAKLTTTMVDQLIGICNEYKKEAKATEATGNIKIVEIEVETFTDTAGTEEKNKKLAEERAKEVETILKRELSGIMYNIKLSPHGETETGYTKANARRTMIRHEFKEPADLNQP